MVLMSFYGLCGCEIVGWVSEKSGCLLFPVIVMSINYFECTSVWSLVKHDWWVMLTFTYV